LFNWQTARIIDVEPITSQTSIFKLEVLDTESFDFVPGQFITFDLPISEKKTQRLKSYSIASHPDKKNILELVIVKIDGGLGTEYLFDKEKCRIGTELRFRGPLGVFNLPTDLSVPYYFICTGTGVAPFRSMIKYIHANKLPYKELNLIFGSRTKADILYHNELTALSQEMENFNYHIALSREDYNGKKGYVHELYQSLAPRSADVQFMLCGWRPMIDQARQELIALNYDKKQIHFELYG
jgi:ferredoxin-NADP reductase